MVKIFGISLKNVVHFSGMEDDDGFNTDIYMNGKQIGYARYGADGGETTVRIDGEENQKAFRKARNAYFSKHFPLLHDNDITPINSGSILPEGYDNMPADYETGFRMDWACTDNASFVFELLELIDLEKAYRRMMKQYRVTHGCELPDGNLNLGEFVVSIKPKALWCRSTSYFAILKKDSTTADIENIKQIIAEKFKASQKGGTKQEVQVVLARTLSKDDFHLGERK